MLYEVITDFTKATLKTDLKIVNDGYAGKTTIEGYLLKDGNSYNGETPVFVREMDGAALESNGLKLSFVITSYSIHYTKLYEIFRSDMEAVSVVGWQALCGDLPEMNKIYKKH